MSKNNENVLIVGLIILVSGFALFILAVAYANSPVTEKIVHKDYKVTVDNFVYDNDTLIFNNTEHHHVKHMSYSNNTGVLSYSTYYKDTSESHSTAMFILLIAFILLVIGIALIRIAWE